MARWAERDEAKSREEKTEGKSACGRLSDSMGVGKTQEVGGEKAEEGNTGGLDD